MQDTIVCGTVVGLLANAVKLLFNLTAHTFKLTPVVFWQIAASRFLEKHELMKPIALIVGGVTDLTTTSLLGIAFIYMIHYTGRDYIWIKGAGFGMVVWVGLLGTLLSQSQAKLNLGSTDIIITMIAHFLFGLSLAYFTLKFYRLPAKKEPLRSK